MASLWKKEYELNIERIDKQHRYFFEMLEATDELVAKEELAAEDIMGIMKTLLEFRSYGLKHFHTEEQLMTEVGYGGIFEHIEMHDSFFIKMSGHIKEFLVLFKAYKSGNPVEEGIRKFITTFVKFATQWYQEHISNVDSKYAYFIKTRN